MARLRLPWLALGMGALLFAAGCHSLKGCINPDAYSGAQDNPRLKIPVGLDGPDTTEALEIPALAQPEARQASGDSCLEEPPLMREAGSVTLPAAGTPGRKPEKDRKREPARKPDRPVGPRG